MAEGLGHGTTSCNAGTDTAHCVLEKPLPPSFDVLISIVTLHVRVPAITNGSWRRFPTTPWICIFDTFISLPLRVVARFPSREKAVRPLGSAESSQRVPIFALWFICP